MLVKYRLPIPPTSLKSAILEQGQAQLFAAAVNAGTRTRDQLWTETRQIHNQSSLTYPNLLLAP